MPRRNIQAEVKAYQARCSLERKVAKQLAAIAEIDALLAQHRAKVAGGESAAPARTTAKPRR